MMKKNIFLVALCLVLALAPLSAMAETMYVVSNNGGSVNLRSGPSTDYPALVSVIYGEPVEVLDVLPGSSWANVYYDGYEGFISIRYLMDHVPPAPNPMPTFVPSPPTQKPTNKPAPAPTAKPSGGTLERTLLAMYRDFILTAYDVQVVPSTPTTYVNLRWAPSMDAPVRTQYWAGTTLRVISETNDWCEVYDANSGLHGFIARRLVRPSMLGAGN